jgi:hypothetical protein
MQPGRWLASRLAHSALLEGGRGPPGDQAFHVALEDEEVRRLPARVAPARRRVRLAKDGSAPQQDRPAGRSTVGPVLAHQSDSLGIRPER